MRRSGAPRAEPTAAMPEATLDPRHGPLDPRKVLTSIGEVVYDWDLASDALAWGANAAEVLGVADRARLASGAGFALMVDPGGGETRHEAILRCEAADEGAGVPYRARYVLRHKGGRPSTIDDTGRWYAGPDGRPARAHGVLRIDRAAPAAVDDAGASARDRAEFLRRMRAEVAEAGRSRRPLTILVLAIDDGLEDEFGFEAGEAVAAEVASRIRGVMRRRDGLVRYAGSRFALALRSCPPDQAEIAAARLRQVIAEPPLATPRGPLALALRIGGATAPDHAIDPATLLARAEEALAAAKRALAQPFVMYDPVTARGGARPREAPVFDALEALNARRILFAAQPVVEAGSRAVAFREALLRIRAGDGTIVNAGAILPGLERGGLVPLFDARMLELVADHLSGKSGRAGRDQSVAGDARDPGLARHLRGPSRRPPRHRLAAHRRDHRDGGGARPRRHPGAARRHEGAGLCGGDRRFRRRAHLVQASARLPGRSSQDRRRLRPEPLALARRPLLRAGADRPRPPPRHRLGRRVGRGRGDGADAHRVGRRFPAGLALRRAGRRRRRRRPKRRATPPDATSSTAPRAAPACRPSGA